MKLNKSLLLIFLIVCLFSIASVSAADDTAMTLEEDATAIGDSDSLSASLDEVISEDINTEEDFDRIMQGSISRTDGYKHYIVAYTAEHHAIMKIELLLLDKDFAVVDQLDLIEYVTPDFASLTESQYEETEELEETEQEAKPSLLKLRPGVKPALRAMEEEA